MALIPRRGVPADIRNRFVKPGRFGRAGGAPDQNGRPLPGRPPAGDPHGPALHRVPPGVAQFKPPAKLPPQPNSKYPNGRVPPAQHYNPPPPKPNSKYPGGRVPPAQHMPPPPPAPGDTGHGPGSEGGGKPPKPSNYKPGDRAARLRALRKKAGVTRAELKANSNLNDLAGMIGVGVNKKPGLAGGRQLPTQSGSIKELTTLLRHSADNPKGRKYDSSNLHRGANKQLGHKISHINDRIKTIRTKHMKHHKQRGNNTGTYRVPPKPRPGGPGPGRVFR